MLGHRFYDEEDNYDLSHHIFIRVTCE